MTPPDHRSTPAVKRLQRAMEDAVRRHYFAEIYPREIADLTARIVKFSAILESVAKDAVIRGDLHALDFIDAIILPPLEEQIEFIRSIARRGWERSA
jgi:hypothetical protein